MRISLIILIGSIFLASCKGDEKEAIDLSDIIDLAEESNNVEQDFEQDSTLLLREIYIDNGLEIEDLTEIENRKFPDRFGPIGDVKHQLVISGDTLNYFKWLYKDSISVMNSFYNWIDCFGDKCKSFFVGEERNMQKEATQILVSDSTIILIEGAKVDFKTWYQFHDSIGYEKDWNYTIEQNYRGRAKWFQFEEKKKVKCEPVR